MTQPNLVQQVGVLLTLLAIVVAGAGVLGWRSASESIATAERLAGSEVPTLVAVKDAQFAVAQVQQWLTDISATRGLDGLDDGFEQAAHYAGVFRERSEFLAARGGPLADRVAELVPLFEQYYADGQRMARAYVEQGPAGGNKMMGAFDESASRLIESVNGTLAEVEATVGAALEHERAAAAALRLQLIYSSLLVAGLLCVTTVVVWRGMRRLSALTEAVRGLASGGGDLAASLPDHGGDEIGELSRGFNAFVAKLREIMIDVAGAATGVAGAATETTSITQTAREGAERQGVEIDRTVESVRSIREATRAVADDTDNAAQVVRESAERARDGEDVVAVARHSIDGLAKEVDATAEVIGAVKEQTEAIGGVLNVIQGVAEQTNLLALNAAIEAARAGEQGRGFAVVADEVRTLASRTQGSTAEIREMIENLQAASLQAASAMRRAQDQAESCVGETDKVGQCFTLIRDSIAGIGEVNQRIQDSVGRQDAAVADIERGFHGIQSVTADTVTAAGQTEAAAVELSKLASALQRSVAGFST